MKLQTIMVLTVISTLLLAGCFGAKKEIAPPVLVPEPTPEPPVVVPEQNDSTVVNQTVNETVPPIQEASIDANLTEQGDTPLTELFNFDKSKRVVFRKVTYDKGFPNLIETTSNVAEDTQNGIARWKVATVYIENGVDVSETIWLSKESLLCAAYEKVYNNTKTDSCPILGPYGSGRTSKNVQRLGNENIIVALGSFDNTPKYEGDSVIYWKTNDKPFPLKYVIKNGFNVEATYELVSYT